MNTNTTITATPAQHTPTPWALDGIQNNSHATVSIIIRSAGSAGNASHGGAPYVAEVVWPRDGLKRCESAMTDEDWANAQFIVRACNNHERLIAALNEVVRQTNLLPAHLTPEAVADFNAAVVVTVRNVARAALAALNAEEQ